MHFHCYIIVILFTNHQQQPHIHRPIMMRSVVAVLLLAGACLGDKPAVAPAYVPEESQAAPVYSAPAAAAPAPAYSAPQAAPAYGAPQAAPASDEYGSPSAPPVQQDAYGAPKAPVQTQDSYGAPAASPVGNQGYYYYYYPVRENAPASAAAQESDDGLLGGLLGGGLLSALIGKKLVIVVVGLAALLVAVAFGLNFSAGRRSFARSFDSISEYITEDNLVTLADFVNRSIRKYQD